MRPEDRVLLVLELDWYCALPRSIAQKVERPTSWPKIKRVRAFGIEPGIPTWEVSVMPLNYPCILMPVWHPALILVAFLLPTLHE